MKKITLLTLLLIATVQQFQGQMLFDFETSSIGFGSWGSAGFAQITNPDPSGINTSSNVGEFTHDGSGGYIGIESDGTFDNIDFTATPTFKVKVWVDEPVEVIFKLQNNPTYQENSEKKYQVSQEETSKWIQLEFNFSDVTATNYNRVVLYFDGGNSIPSGAGHKYYFDDIEKSSEVADPTCTDGIQNGDETGVDCGGSSCNACEVLPSFPFDFETSSIGFGSWGSAGFAQITNPDPSGINTSSNVGEFTHDGSGGYIGIESDGTFDNIDFTATPTFKVKVWVDEPVEVIFKLQNNPTYQENSEKKYQVSQEETNKWIQLEFNFSDVTATNYNRVVLYFDGGNSIPSGAGHKYYFDDIEKSSEVADPTCTDGIQNGDETGVDCGGSSCNECPALLSEFNFDFDTPTSITSERLDFNENAINTVTDGINPTLNVGELTGVNNDWWSQIKVEDANGIDLSGGDRGISLKVKGPRALPVTIKIESGGDEHAVTVDYNTVDVWQELLFDFTSFNSTNNTKIAVFFDMQVNGDVVTDPTLNIFQIDDFVFGNFNTLSSDIFEIEGLVTFPNPTNNSWNISNKNQVITSIEVFNVLGKKVISMQPNTISAEVDASNLTSGLYISKIATKLGTVTRKLIKQ
jgi:hypothetical protein